MTRTLIALLVCCLWPGALEARVRTVAAGGPVHAAPLTSGGVRLHWKDGRLLLRLSRTVHLPDDSGAVDARESVESVHNALAAAAKAWTGGGLAAVSVEIETTDEQRADPAQNVVTFTDPAPFDSGQCDRRAAAACALLSYVVETGEIVGAAIAFNPYARFSSIGLEGTYDAGAVMLHETGHVLGLGHSGLLYAAMSPFVESVSTSGAPAFALRELAADDLLSLAETYPAEAAQPGVVEGVVQLDGNAVAAAHVIAVAEDGTPVRSALTGADGRYSMAVGAGNYTLLAEPLDGPVLPAHFGQESAARFPTVFWTAAGGQFQTGEVLAVEAGARLTADFALTSGEVANVRRVGVVEADSVTYVYKLDLARGGDYLLSAIREPFTGTPALALSGAAETLGDTAVGPDEDLAERRIRIPADARPGVYNLYYHNGASTAALAGAVRVTLRPAVESVRFTEDRRGIEISGTDLALREAEGAGETQLGGVSVRIGGRFAPLAAVSPTAIRAGIPAGIGPGEVEVTVMAGANARSAPVVVEVQ